MIDQKTFEDLYHYKVVKALGKYFKELPIKEYIVTASLINCDNSVTFGIKALDYNLENKHFFTLRIKERDFDEAMADFEIKGDGREDYVKPVILDEILGTFEKIDGEDWIYHFSSYIFKEKCGYHKFNRAAMNREAFEGKDEYMFIYKSVFDIGKPSCYIIELPKGLKYREEIEKYVEPFRKDVLDNQVAFGLNQRLLRK